MKYSLSLHYKQQHDKNVGAHFPRVPAPLHAYNWQSTFCSFNRTYPCYVWQLPYWAVCYIFMLYCLRYFSVHRKL